jgi:hypothetical protein
VCLGIGGADLLGLSQEVVSEFALDTLQADVDLSLKRKKPTSFLLHGSTSASTARSGRSLIFIPPATILTDDPK